MNQVVDIVMAEDNPPDMFVFRESLRRRGIAFELENYTNGEEAAKAIAAMTSPPDLFVLDLNIPRIHGLELLRTIREHPLTASTPVAILTSSQADSDRTQAANYGADLYLVKPDGFKEFVDRVGAAIEELLKQRPSANGGQAAASGCRSRRRPHAPAAARSGRASRRGWRTFHALTVLNRQHLSNPGTICMN